MASINISYPHQRTLQEAREAAQTFAGKLQAKLGVESRWQDNTLLLERTGVNGAMSLSEGLVEVDLTLGMMLTPMKGQIETEINKQLARYLA
ncbi:MAG: polyhydroxyalkanoic acid synthase [Oceanospirillaceae bacterium]|jgi:putative polyhydroxyalkanoate system protein|nr:polyhydroxyalkanoic acid synthase [Oceanospirillaceae bacterium]MBT4443893.1 polyhydroxyalkanoic acid synthase [Oceanospirillaceae bacterium]MBT6078412.1 polyhydroxyalkanoic acid synthase [Oceanospirillaceae bacterium]MBT7330808.1 polyhydroxyalkanoic acid synthase [Oceanospirillaceae bacterium]